MYTCVYRGIRIILRCTPRVYICDICFSLVSSALHQNDRNAGHSTRARIRESCSRALHDTDTEAIQSEAPDSPARVNSTSPLGDKRQVRAIRTTGRAALRDHRHARNSLARSLARLRARAHTYTCVLWRCQVISCAPAYSFPFADPRSGSRP
jgi:hypothetical protein